MKFEIEIDDNKMQEIIHDIVFDSRNHSGLSYEFQKLIRGAFQEKVKEMINDDLLISITEKVNALIDKEIETSLSYKLPGWCKRRIKELLESVRKKFKDVPVFEIE